MPICSYRAGPALLVTALLLAGCGAEEKFESVGPEIGLPSSEEAPTTATTLPALVPYTGDGFTISLPGTPTLDKRTGESAAGPIEVSTVSVAGASNAYAVSYSSAPASGFDIDTAARGTAAMVEGTLTDVSPVTYKGYAGRDFRVAQAKGGKVTVFARVLRVKKRVFLVQAIFEGDLKAAPDDRYRQVLESLAFSR